MKTQELQEVMARKKKSWAQRLLKTYNPAKLLMYAFLIVIMIGSILLSLPVSNQGKPASYIDNLFTAVSAVCVTGLSTVTAASQYSHFGKVVLMFLMEIGGIGPMTIIAILFLRNKKMATDERKLFAAASGKSNLYKVEDYIRRIIIYTVIFELCGFALLSFRMTGIYGLSEGLFNSLFLSISAFTNAGFDPIGSESLCTYVGDPIINMAIMTLIVFGGLGFMVWFELKDLFVARFKRGTALLKKRKWLSEHSSTVLKTTLWLIVSGFVLVYLFEAENAGTIMNLEGDSKFLACLFQSVTLRTAGFATISFGRCTRPLLLIMCVYMLIGGSPGGTAGGMKTTTIAVLYNSAINTLDDSKPDAVISNRRIAPSLLKHAYVILTLYVSITFLAVMGLTISEPSTGLLELIFEAVSAIATVGVSTGITSSLSVGGRIIIMILMFIGRLGPLSVYAAFHKERKLTNHITYPDANIIIG
ncbi:MAG: potassium transporter TrkG [Erysipelotrichaceae bacterium]|nr:potassium transporter TrkG [Erysipelotrichaceae bacterium]